jgi:hypothetical protein
MRDYAPSRGYAFLVLGALLLVFSRLILPALYPLFVIKNMDTGGQAPMMFTEGIEYAIKQLTIIGIISSFLGVIDIFRNQNRFCVKCGFKGRFIGRKFDERTEQALDSFRPKNDKVDDVSGGRKISITEQPIKPLIKMLSFRDESKRQDALATLKEITGMDFGEDQSRWENWYMQSKQSGLEE